MTRHSPRPPSALIDALSHGRVVISDAVWAETRAVFGDGDGLKAALDSLGIEYHPLSRDAADAAGRAWAAYRGQGGKRDRVVADFLIAAHAAVDCSYLLTRDRGFYRRYFQGLDVRQP